MSAFGRDIAARTECFDTCLYTCRQLVFLRTWQCRQQFIPNHLQSFTSQHTVIFSFIRLVVCLTTGPKPLPNRALHIVRSRASSFKWEYPLLSWRSSSSFLRLLPCLPVTSIPPCIFLSVTHCRRQFLHKMWPIQFAYRLSISCRYPHN
jgi:hypothetical protein